MLAWPMRRRQGGTEPDWIAMAEAMDTNVGAMLRRLDDLGGAARLEALAALLGALADQRALLECCIEAMVAQAGGLRPSAG